MNEIRDIFESILCLCSEGTEFMDKVQLSETISKEAVKGIDACKKVIDCESEKVNATGLGIIYHPELRGKLSERAKSDIMQMLKTLMGLSK